MQESQETQVQSLGQEDPLVEEMATHSSVLAGEIPWTEEPGLQSMRAPESLARLKRFSTHARTASENIYLQMKKRNFLQ